MRQLPFSLLLCGFLSLPVVASEGLYTGPPLKATYDGPNLVDNSQYRYTGPDRLRFSTSDLLATTYPELLPLRAAIDTWASRLGIHPRVLSAVAEDFFAGSPIFGDQEDIQSVVQIASALATVFDQQAPHPLAASRAVVATAEALFFELRLPVDLATRRASGGAPEDVPSTFGYFQPPWEIGDTWAGGGAHGTSYNSLDFWGTYQVWGEDTSPYWVSAMQAGTVRVWSSCSMAVIHPNGWVTNYYHLDNIQVADFATALRNDRLANYANQEAQALCQGGFSTGPHVHMSLSYNGQAVTVDETQVDFTAFSNHVGVEPYDGNCTTSWYSHFTEGQVCPYYDRLLNNVPESAAIFIDSFETGELSAWSVIVQ